MHHLNMIKFNLSPKLSELFVVWKSTITGGYGTESYPTIRFNKNAYCLEYFDSGTNTWHPIGFEISIDENTSHPNISDIMDLANYAQEKRREEERIKEIINKYPEIKLMKDKLDVLIKLVDKINDEK